MLTIQKKPPKVCLELKIPFGLTPKFQIVRGATKRKLVGFHAISKVEKKAHNLVTMEEFSFHDYL